MKKTLSLTTVFALCIITAIITFVTVSVYDRIDYDHKLDEINIRNASNISALEKEYSDAGSLSSVTKALRILREAKSEVDEHYVFDIDDSATMSSVKDALYDIIVGGDVPEDDVQNILLRAYFSAIGDPFTMYHTPAEMNELKNESNARLYGIGIYVYFDPDTEYIYVNRVMPGSPAEKAGLLRGDAITAVEDVPVSEDTYDKCVRLVAGQMGEPIKLDVLRGGEHLTLSPVRGEVTTKSVFTEYIGDFALITIVEFTGRADKDFIKAIDSAEDKGVKGYIFDVRDNPGGDLDIICEVLDKLLPKGPIVNIMDKNQNELYSYDSDASSIEKPMVVLINGNTASAGELFTAALKDYQKATIIGDVTYGKGTMQQIFPLSDGSGVRISVNYYNPPYSENYHLKGVTPDITVKESEYLKNRPFLRGSDNDNVFAAALSELDRLITAQNKAA